MKNINHIWRKLNLKGRRRNANNPDALISDKSIPLGISCEDFFVPVFAVNLQRNVALGKKEVNPVAPKMMLLDKGNFKGF